MRQSVNVSTFYHATFAAAMRRIAASAPAHLVHSSIISRKRRVHNSYPPGIHTLHVVVKLFLKGGWTEVGRWPTQLLASATEASNHLPGQKVGPCRCHHALHCGRHSSARLGRECARLAHQLFVQYSRLRSLRVARAGASSRNLLTARTSSYSVIGYVFPGSVRY